MSVKHLSVTSTLLTFLTLLVSACQSSATLPVQPPVAQSSTTPTAAGSSLDGIAKGDITVTLNDQLTATPLDTDMNYTYAGKNLAGMDFSRKDLRKYSFMNSNLTGANFTSSVLYNASFAGANLTNANLTASFMHNADLTNANLTAANLAGTVLTGATLKGINLSKTGISSKYGLGSALGNGEQRGNFEYYDFTGANFSNADASSVNFFGANLTNANFDSAVMIQTRLQDATVKGINLSYVNLAFIIGEAGKTNNFYKFDFTGATLVSAKAGSSIFKYANLTNAQFDKANLKSATLTFANLSNTDFSGATWTTGKVCASPSLGDCL